MLDPDSVRDEASFLAFVSELAADRRHAASQEANAYGAQAGWENRTIEGFLESALAWAEDTSFGRTQGMQEDTSVWQRVAVFLYCGKIYE